MMNQFDATKVGPLARKDKAASISIRVDKTINLKHRVFYIIDY